VGNSLAKVMEDTFQRNYLRFFEIAEGRRRWNLFTDIPWNKVNQAASNTLEAVMN
jgi:acyl-[acyl-carrier-protein] desaturase